MIGYALRGFGYPLVPLLLGFLLGAPLETNFRRALMVSDEGAWIFVKSPVSALLLFAATALAVFFQRRR